MRGLTIAAAAIAAFGLAGSAQAVSYFSLAATNGTDPGIASYEHVITSFDGGGSVGYDTANSSGFSLDRGTVGAATAPAGDSSTYAAVSGGGSMLFDLRNYFSSRSTAARSISVYLGSIEADDYIEVLGLSAGGSLNTSQPLMTITGAELLAAFGGTSDDQRLYINFSPTEQVSALVFGSTSSVFEFDTLAVSAATYAIDPSQTVTADNLRPAATINGMSPNQSDYMLSSNGVGSVPEPTIWAMMLSGFLMVGGLLRSRRRTAIAFG